MKKIQVTAQLYSFREFIKTPEAVAQTLSKLKKIGYDSVQLSSSIAPMPEEQLRTILEGEGFIAPTAHESAASIMQDTEAIIEHLLRLGCYHVAYPYPSDPNDFSSEERVVEFARKLNTVALMMKKSGITLAYHNHSIEFMRFGSRNILELIYAHAPDVDAEIDTYWVQEGGASPLKWVEDMAGRMQVLHLKDYGVVENSKTVMASIGSGNLDWNRIISAAEKGGVECFVVEHDGYCDDPFASFEASMNFLKDNYID